MKWLKGNLLTQILVAFIIAIILGVILGESMDVVAPRGDLFLRLSKFIIAPLVLSTVVIGIARIGDPTARGRVGRKALAYDLMTTAFAIAIGLGIAYVINPGKGLSLNVEGAEEVEVGEQESVVDTLLNIVPENPFEALANADILQIIFFAIAVG